MKKILIFIKDKFFKKENYKLEDENNILLLIEDNIEQLEYLKKQVISCINNSEKHENWINYENVLIGKFKYFYKKIVINNFWFEDMDFRDYLLKIFYLIQENNFFIKIEPNPINIVSEGQKEVTLFKIAIIDQHIYNILNKLLYINVQNNPEYARSIIIANLIFIISKIENKNGDLEEIIEKYNHSSSVKYVLENLNSNIWFAENKESTLKELKISLVSIVESMKREVSEMKLSKKYYNQTDKCFARYFIVSKRYKNLNPI